MRNYSVQIKKMPLTLNNCFTRPCIYIVYNLFIAPSKNILTHGTNLLAALQFNCYICEFFKEIELF